MALDFIKKVFSFGRKQVEEVPAEASVPGAPEREAPETDVASAANAEVAAPESAPPLPSGGEPVAEPQGEAAPAPAPESEREHLPHEGGMRFTPETADDAGLSPAKPADTEHAGEPPIEPVEAPQISAAGTAQQPEPASEPSAEEVAAAEAFGTAGANARQADDLAPPPVAAPVPDAGEDVADRPSDEEPEEEQGEETTGGEEIARPAAVSPPQARQVRVGRSISEAPEPAPEAPATPDSDRPGWWHRLRQGLARSSAQLSGQVTGIFTRRKLDEDTLQELEDVLIQADLGVETAMRITDTLASGRYGRDISAEEVSHVMAGEIEKVLAPVARPLELDLSHKPHIILVVGVNGTGKTTTIGKLAAKLAGGGLKVMLAAGDTFRAAAIEQLKIWGERTGADVISTKLGADAAGLAYEAIEAARQKGSDVLIIDTAGRLQNRTELMDELAKVVRVIGKLDPDAPHTVLQTLDATTGQNALNQVEIFRNVAGVNGLVMTKLDGTARGGILVAIAAKHKLPVYFIGVGEGVDDLEPFEAHDFATAIAGEAQ